jgi:hypothetical protein
MVLGGDGLRSSSRGGNPCLPLFQSQQQRLVDTHRPPPVWSGSCDSVGIPRPIQVAESRTLLVSADALCSVHFLLIPSIFCWCGNVIQRGLLSSGRVLYSRAFPVLLVDAAFAARKSVCLCRLCHGLGIGLRRERRTAPGVCSRPGFKPPGRRMGCHWAERRNHPLLCCKPTSWNAPGKTSEVSSGTGSEQRIGGRRVNGSAPAATGARRGP